MFFIIIIIIFNLVLFEICIQWMTIFTALNGAVLQVRRFRILLGEACSHRFLMTLQRSSKFWCIYKHGHHSTSIGAAGVLCMAYTFTVSQVWHPFYIYSGHVQFKFYLILFFFLKLILLLWSSLKFVWPLLRESGGMPKGRMVPFYFLLML